MNTEYTLQATKRENKGTSSSKKIRKNNGIPAVVYGDKNNNNIIYIVFIHSPFNNYPHSFDTYYRKNVLCFHKHRPSRCKRTGR